MVVQRMQKIASGVIGKYTEYRTKKLRGSVATRAHEDYHLPARLFMDRRIRVENQSHNNRWPDDAGLDDQRMNDTRGIERRFAQS